MRIFFRIDPDRDKVIFYILAVIDRDILFLKNAFNLLAIGSQNFFLFDAGFAPVGQRANMNEIAFRRRGGRFVLGGGALCFGEIPAGLVFLI